MDNLAADFIINLNNPIEAEYELGETEHFDCSFELFASGTVWGSIDGDISNQTDLKNALDSKADITTVNELSGDLSNLTTTVNNNYTELDGRITQNHNDITSLSQTLQSYGDIVTYDAADFATAAQGVLANTALQPGDNITELVNNAGYITSADLPTLEDLTTQAQMNAINSGATSVNIAQIASNTQAISTETLNRQNADNGLQSQIDAIVASSDVFDIVGTYAELQAYDISTVPPNDIIKVLVDSTHNNAATYYRCIETNNVKSWSYIGSEGAYYTKSEADGRFVPLERTINGKALSNNITLDATDVGALPSSTVIPTVNNGTLDIQVNGTSVGTFTANQSGNTTANIVVPDSATWGNITGDIADQTDLQTALDDKQDVLTAGTDLEIIAGSNNTVINFTNESGYITGINSTDVTNALGYTPVNPSSLATVATSGDYDDLTNKPTIPTVGDGTITITQGGITKGTFTTNQSGNSTIALDAGGSGGSYSAGTGIVISNDTISIDTSVVAQLSDIPTNYVTTDTAQNITGRKTFLGEKAIYFKQSATTDKLGFTLYNSSDTELGAFEWRPSTISGGALLNINVPYSSSNYVGFRYWGTAVNIIAPKVATAGNYYIPTHITDGNTTVTASSNGTVNISSLLPNVSGYLENTATGTDSLTILGTASTADYSVNIGINSVINADEGVAIGCEAIASGGVAIGRGAEVDSGGGVAIGISAGVSNNGDIAIGNYAGVNGTSAIALGYQATATANYAIQIGNGDNSDANTLQIGNYTLLDTSTGLIPDARLSSNIARTSQIPTAISDLTDDTATTPIDKAESVVDNNSGSLKFWSGTKVQYDAIATKNADTLYNITDDANPTLSILEMLYPVGSIYIGTMSVCPLQTLGVGTWQLVAVDRVLQGAGTRGDVGDTINESLPNHQHIETFVFSEGLRPLASVYGAQATGGNTKSIGENITHTSNDSVDKALTWGANNATYQDNAPVQQDAYLVNIWERIS